VGESLLSIIILHQNCDPALAQDRTLPYNTYIVKYQSSEDEFCYDLIISNKQMDIFDFYWDKYRDGIKGWKQSEGRVNPKLWEAQAKNKKG
jgi:hypothetical protein